MKLKPIEIRMVIRCKTFKEAEMLYEHYGLPQWALNSWCEYDSNTCYDYLSPGRWEYDHYAYYIDRGRTIVDFEDLVIDWEGEKPTISTESEPDKSYITCTLIDGTVLDFDRLCDSFCCMGKTENIVQFKATNGNKFISLSFIPISQIKKIDTFYTDEERAWLLSEEV